MAKKKPNKQTVLSDEFELSDAAMTELMTHYGHFDPQHGVMENIFGHSVGIRWKLRIEWGKPQENTSYERFSLADIVLLHE